jgi:hypothetical protein
MPPACVLAMDLGSCVDSLQRLSEIDRGVCRRRRECFSIETMVESYEKVYRTIFELEAPGRS